MLRVRMCRIIFWYLISCMSSWWFSYLGKQIILLHPISCSFGISTLYVSCCNQSDNYLVFLTILREKYNLWIPRVCNFLCSSASVSNICLSTTLFLVCFSYFMSYIAMNTKSNFKSFVITYSYDWSQWLQFDRLLFDPPEKHFFFCTPHWFWCWYPPTVSAFPCK